MSEREHPGQEPSIESFLSGENRRLSDWHWLWEGDHRFPLHSHRGFVGSIIVVLKRLFRGFVRAPQSDLWERQRAYNLLVQEYLERSSVFEGEVREHFRDQAARSDEVIETAATLGRDLQTMQGELSRDLVSAQEAHGRDQIAVQEELRAVKDELWVFLESQNKRLLLLEGFHKEGLTEINEHTAALFARLDQKLDRYRQLTRERWDRLGSLLEVAEGGGAPALARAIEEEKYVEFEGLFRGREAEIGERLAPYLKILSGRGDVLDLGCGRGEALEVFASQGIACRGIDSSSEMVEICRGKGLRAEVDDLFSALSGTDEGSLGGVVSFHVIEHLPATSLDGLVRLAWRALRPGGVLILETPSPLSLVVGARNFWIDPTHRRPIHPDSLKAVFDLNGFDPIERIDLQPFSEELRLPEIDTSEVGSELMPLVEQVNSLRDRLDHLLYGFQDYGMVGYKPR
jgi:O-antigen chain-terminating methyltransferase